jgi:hypothetical protein
MIPQRVRGWSCGTDVMLRYLWRALPWEWLTGLANAQ